VGQLGAKDAPDFLVRTGPSAEFALGAAARPNDGFVRLAYLMNPPHPELTAEYAALYNYPDLDERSMST
jgi:hypothetical protein